MSDLRPYISSGFEASNWWEHQIFNGDASKIVMGVSNFVVPAVGDFVMKEVDGIINRRLVTKVTENIPTYKRVYEDTADDGVEDLTVADLSATAMVLMRPSVSPIVAAIHIGLPIESDISIGYARLFTGTDISNLSAIVSRQLDNDGEVIDDKIKVTPDPINNKTYRAEQFHLDRILDDKSRGTLVFYGMDDTPIGKYTIIFRVSEALINYSSTELFITDLVLESGSVNPLASKEILIEKGFLNSSFNPRVYKVFNTGQREEISLTSRSLKLEGWGNYIYGEENDVFPLAVQYRLAPNEVSDMVSDENGEVITAEYTIRVTDDADSINYKLYPIINWDKKAGTYTIKFFMYDSSYKTRVDVTDIIDLSSTFEGYNYVDKQVFNFNVDLLKAGITPDQEYATGSFAVRLFSDPMVKPTPYVIHMVPTDDVRYYGENLRARLKFDMGVHSLEIDSDYTSYDEWVDNVYYKLLPTYDSNTNSNAPHPTHVDVYIGDNYVTLDVLSMWNTGAKWTYDLPDGMNTVEMRWYSRNSDGARNYLAYSTMQLEIV